jgi:membrane dipeptidase
MKFTVKTLTALVILLAGCRQPQFKPADAVLYDRAQQLARRYVIVDTHVDVPYRLEEHPEDISQSTSGDFDYPRARQGGLDALFMAVYTSPKREADGTAKSFAEKNIDLINDIVASHPDKFEFALTPDDILAQHTDDKVSVILALENGAPLEGNLDNVKHFYDRGVRYITLAHSKCNHICDSSYDKERRWHGLSPFGRQLVKEMNRIGMIIDVSHVSDETFWQVLGLSDAPVVATHSSCRRFTPGWERNLSDDMIVALAKRGGVIQVNFGGMFLDPKVTAASRKRWDTTDAYIEKHNLTGQAAEDFSTQYANKHPIPNTYVSDVADHIDHIVNLVGIDYVGLGSDFDGVDGILPVGLTDVSCYPNLIYELLRRGYSDSDIEKICSNNFLRTFAQIQNHPSQ